VDDVPTPSNPSIVPDFAHQDGVEVVHYLGANDTMLKQFWLFCGEQPASLYAARLFSHIGH
jgi:hypothetical protein